MKINRRGFLRRVTQVAGVVAGATAVNVLDTALPAQATLREEIAVQGRSTLTAVSLISCVQADERNIGGSYMRWDQEAGAFIPVEQVHHWTAPRP